MEAVCSPRGDSFGLATPERPDVGVGLGLREGEAFGLTLPRVDFLRRKVQVLSQAQRGQLAAELKTEASTRTIPADQWVLNEISAHIQRLGTGPGEAIVRRRADHSVPGQRHIRG